MSRVRSAGFAAALVVLVGAVPALGWMGLTLIRDSKAGTLIARVSDPRAPGYEAIIDPTPTALLIQKNAKGKLISLTFLALGGANGGGSVIFLPIDAGVDKPAFGVDRLGTAYTLGGDQDVAGQVGALLKVGLGDVIDVNDVGWAALTAKAAPIRFNNPDALSSGPRRFPAGPIALRPTDVGPYLTALNRDESDLNRLNRHQLFWQAWLRAIGPSPAPDALPGETNSGIGFFVRTLARGPVRSEPLPVNPQGIPLYLGDQTFVPIVGQIRKDIAEMVPYPTAPSPGARVLVRLLNGTDGDPIPQSIVRALVLNGAAITVVGNDRRFGRRETLLQYRDPTVQNRARLMRIGLGGHGKLRLDLQGPDAVDVTIVLGRDVLGSRRAPGASRPPTSAAGSVTTITESQGSGG